MLLDFIIYFIDSTNESELNISKGLPVKTVAESLDILKGKYKVSEKRK